MTNDANPIVTLLTDFGVQDSYVGQLKGIILGINPHVTFVDISHSVRRHDIRDAAFLIYSAWRAFPPGTVHLCIVDPGVGSPRRILLLKLEDQYFLGPDNGIFTYLLLDSEQKMIPHAQYSVTTDSYFTEPEGATFHGRDIFAPVAAQLTLGIDPVSLGPEINDPVRIETPAVVNVEGKISGAVIHIDNFGNLITNFRHEHLLRIETFYIAVTGDLIIETIAGTFFDVHMGTVLAYWGSAGFLEIGMREENLAEKHHLKIGHKVEIFCEKRASK